MISLKWLIQTWHALILAIVLVALGVGFYFNEKAHRLTQLDSTLDQQIHPLVRASEVMQGKVRPPKKQFDPGNLSPRDLPPPSGGWKIEHNAFSPSNIPQTQQAGEQGKRSAFANVEWRFEYLGFYCIVWNTATGKLIYRSENAPEMEAPMDIDDGYMKRIRDGRYREIFLVNPSVRIIVAFDLNQVYADLSLLKCQITGVMLAIYAVSLLVGSWLVSRSLLPLKAIQYTTRSIAEGNLKARIPQENVGKVRELFYLTKDLNNTFNKLDSLFERQVRFTADASHELRTPLTALIGHIKLGRSRERSVEDLQDILETCERSALRIQRITDDLMELSRYDSGRVELEYELLPLDVLLAGLANDLVPVFAQYDSTLSTDLQPVTASCDPFRIEQVITNLINNALQHNDRPVDIQLKTRFENGQAVIEVIDNGKGIQPENLDKLFDRFFQETTSRTKGRGRQNSGLGLAISQAIITAHNGTLEANSQPYVRTTFTIALPVAT